ncbi:hypothetical protein BT63DRAFT_27130 [Microthyrium microscopicum]|uniref:Heterokaryon incompatibility domain-containing protein n=1 Tax=Microthyrium microscopicum TaxID=703497 RepID=A0A6A6UUD7_9PEZI|nr:hypothetical protein BT63DRAFT_27130 [Microthyrium microscopicum]
MSGVSYRTLDEGAKEVRLLIIEDKVEDDNATVSPLLRCHLVKTSLHLYSSEGAIVPGGPPEGHSYASEEIISRGWTDTPFQALSYVWGDPTPVSEIEIDGRFCKISQNLSQALLSIYDNTAFRVIWADAVSINQQDNEEKSWQVQQMVHIYSRAESVLSWLGVGDTNSTLAMQQLNNLGRDLTISKWKFTGTESMKNKISEEHNQVGVKYTEDSSTWRALITLTERS